MFGWRSRVLLDKKFVVLAFLSVLLSAYVLDMFLTVNIWYCSALGANVALFLAMCPGLLEASSQAAVQPCGR